MCEPISFLHSSRNPDERYPCQTTDGTRGAHVHKKTHVEDSRSAFVFWASVASVDAFDLIFLECNLRDTFVQSLPNALEDKGRTGETAEYQSGWFFEVLLRRLLLMRKPDPVAIVTFNADYRGKIWAPPPWARE